ncbi:MAG: protein kinase domain-containing protein, partial [Candidatus Acidiferrales bacterium]
LLELGRGAMGAVYQARDPQIDRIVAIKVILTQGLSNQELEGFKQRFYREARAAGKMSHPGIVTIHDIAEDENGRPYLVMEFVEGSTLQDIAAQRLANGEKLPLSQALDIAIQVANALDYAHKRGVVHRDVKPANILVTHDGVAKVADFGIAKVSGIAITQTGGFLGTPAFMSPEQFSGGDIDARSDLFSLGAMLYWMFTGAQPFSGETLTTVSFRIVFTYPVPAHQVNTDLPPEIHTVLMRCLAKNPLERYASCRDLAADLEAIKLGKPIAATPLPVQEATIFNAPGLPAVSLDPAIAAAVAIPPAATPTATVAAAPAGTATDRTLVPRPQTVYVPARRRSPLAAIFGFARARPLITIAALLLATAFAAGGMWLWPQSQGISREAMASATGSQQPSQAQEAPGTAEPAPSDPVPVSVPPIEEAREASKREPGPPPHSKGRGRRNPPARPVVPTATLVIDCQHNFKDGTLEIFMDDKRLATLSLR